MGCGLQQQQSEAGILKTEAEMPNLKPVQPYEDALKILPLRIKCTTLACSHSESQERTNSCFT